MEENIITFVKKSFAVLRWSYGYKNLETPEQDLKFTVMLLRQKPSGKLGYTVFPEEGFVKPTSIEERLELTRDISFVFAIYGCCSVLIAQELQYTKDNGDLATCCAFHVYDVTGLVMRCFASTIHCVDVFLNHNSPEDLIKNKDLGNSANLKDLNSSQNYVCQTEITESMKICGPLPAWDMCITESLNRMKAKSNSNDDWH